MSEPAQYPYCRQDKFSDDQPFKLQQEILHVNGPNTHLNKKPKQNRYCKAMSNPSPSKKTHHLQIDHNKSSFIYPIAKKNASHRKNFLNETHSAQNKP